MLNLTRQAGKHIDNPENARGLKLLTTCMALIKNLAKREKMKLAGAIYVKKSKPVFNETHSNPLTQPPKGQTRHFQLETECAARFDNIAI